MSSGSKFDLQAIHFWRAAGLTWAEIQKEHYPDASLSTLRKIYSRWQKQQLDGLGAVVEAVGRSVRGEIGCSCEAVGGTCDTCTPKEDELVATLTEDEVKRITSLEDLIAFFKVDTERWQVRDYRINKWENYSVANGITPLYQVRANLIPNIERDLAVARQVMDDFLEDAAVHAPQYYLYPAANRLSPTTPDPVLFELAVMDPHIGMLAWGREVGGKSWDSSLAVNDYAAAVEHLLAYAHLYPVERILYLVGNDLLHVDGPAPAGKGSNRGGATAAGTVQDVDSRLAKMFTTARRAVVKGIDLARSIAPVDVLVVPGNHDTQQMYRLGEVLAAWYRNDAEVKVTFGPNKRKFFGYGKNSFMLCHGEEYRRQRENLPLIFATECPADLWVRSTHREIHTGHNHAALAGAYHPTSELSETRSIRTRSLPALTPADAWHHEEGYAHQRTATALVYKKSGGLSGFFEFHP